MKARLESLSKIEALEKIRSIANYQFGRGAGIRLFPKNVKLAFSPNTGRIKHIFLNGELLCTLRPTNGYFGLTLYGARRLAKILPRPRLRVVIQGEVAEFIKQGKSVFAKHVVAADQEIRPMEEVLVTDQNDEVIAVGRAILTGTEMPRFKRGVAVKVRHGVNES